MNERINEELLDYDDDQSLHEGLPFTGIGYLEYPDRSLKKESIYVDGYEQGLCREWYPNKQLKREWTADHGTAVGEVKTWYEDGKIKSIALYEFGIEILFKEWDERGILTAKREIDINSELYEYLMTKRDSIKTH
jgi:antitoxin component YwqK of YwqJK toxin-antitoxin module